MRLPHHPSASTRALSLAALVWAAACSDVPTASRTAPAPRHDGTTAVRTLRPPTLIPNSIKYRDAGYKPASGKAGSASLYVQALVGRDGKTEMQVATSPWGITGGWTPGAITHLQVKAFDSNGKLLATRTHAGDLPGGGAATLTYGGMTRGTQLQVQGTVRGIDANRTDVPVVTGTVRLRPNLAVREVMAPAQVREGSLVPISATVVETNGDVGAWSTCQLYVDGRYQDWAQGIWVDAGDAVTCLFLATFVGSGKHQVEARLGDASPRDDDPRDNAASAEVEVEARNELFYSASASDFRLNSHVLSRRVWTVTDSLGNSSGYETQDESHLDHALRQVMFSGWSFRGMSRLPRLEVEEESGGAPVFSASYQLENTWWYGYGGRVCGQGWDGAGVVINVCTHTDGLGGTDVFYTRTSTRSTYHSSNYYRSWDGGTGEEFVYSYNFDNEYESGLPLTPLLGSDFTIRVRLVADSTELSATSTFPLFTAEYGYAYPLSCWTTDIPWLGASEEFCNLYEYSIKNVSGYGYSQP